MITHYLIKGDDEVRDFFRSAKFKIIIAVIALLIGFMIYSLTTGGYAILGVSVFDAVTEPFQKASKSISERVSLTIDTFVHAQNYRKENEQLREQLNKLYNDIIDYDRIQTENSELKQLLGLKEENEDFVFSSPCSVIARTTNDPYGSFTIDKGSKDGISPNDPVMTSQGMLGVCYDVSESTSKVRTLLSPKSAVGVTVLRTKAAGILEGGYEYASDGLCIMSYIDKSAEIMLGDIVFTSGSETFPSGQLVGTVEEIVMEDSGLSKYALIKPAADPFSVSTVFVITDFEGQKAEE